jgi:hypothetical protein
MLSTARPSSTVRGARLKTVEIERRGDRLVAKEERCPWLAGPNRTDHHMPAVRRRACADAGCIAPAAAT